MSFSTFTKSAFCFFSVTRTESLTSFQAFWTRTPTRCIRKSRRLLGHENVVPFLSRPEFYRLFSPANLKLKLQKYGFLLLQKFICSHHMYPLFLKRCCSIIPLIFYFYHFFVTHFCWVTQYVAYCVTTFMFPFLDSVLPHFCVILIVLCIYLSHQMEHLN